ncbi:hypothetical protein C8R46DRAFT_1283124 [Mycena filopes]|nr:hypothetical protein C8R46DRAFT_1283124 [Mycena filopes]
MKRLLRRLSSHTLEHSHSDSNRDNPPPPLPTRDIPHNQTAVLTTTAAVTAISTEQKIWEAVNHPDGISSQEKLLNKIEDGATAAANTSSGVVSTLKAIAANEEVQEIGKAILSGVPALMSALETLSKVHPFAAIAFIPFQFAYKQELKRHDNDRNRMSLFEAIKDVMRVIVELKGVNVTQDDKRLAPDGKPLVSRLAELGELMKKDIEACYGALDAMHTQSLIVRFCKASDWSGRLAGFKVRFKTRREDLQFALTLNTATVIQDMSTMIKDMWQTKFQEEFQAARTPEDRIIDSFFKANGGEKVVMGDPLLLAKLIDIQNKLNPTHNIKSAYAAGAGAQSEVAVILKQYRTDVSVVIQDNMESFSKRMDLSMHLLGEDLKRDIRQEGDRVIRYLKGGPHLRVRDKIMRQVWKDQGWRGSAKTRTLVLALRDYLVERAEHARDELGPDPALSASGPGAEDPQDPETAMGVPLADSWMLDYLQVKRLRNIQQVLDPDTSGFSTIAEVNAFTQSCHVGWSLPRWISYWAMGWQIYATRYCTEIDEIFNQMFLLRDQIGLQMPGNKWNVNAYIADIWPIVTGLTSGIERFEGTDWLAEQFKDYIEAEESAIRDRLDRIRYGIESSDTVHEILRGEPIERSILMLLAIILRRHLEKIHLCTTMEMHDDELFDDSFTIQFVVEAAWLRYTDLLEFYKHQQIVDMKQNFDWFSKLLPIFVIRERVLRFLDYFAWTDWTSEKEYRSKEIISYSAKSNLAINEIPVEQIKTMLLHEVNQPLFGTSQEDSKNQPNEWNPFQDTDQPTSGVPALGAATQSEAPTVAVPDTAEVPASHSEALIASYSGTWFGFHVLPDTGRPTTGMFYVKITASVQNEQTELTIGGEATSFGLTPEIGTIKGTASTTAKPDGKFTLEFQHLGYHYYSGTLSPDLDVINGECVSSGYEGDFILKKTPTDSIMCHRPLFPRRLDTKELWSFAISVVLDDLRRRNPSRQYVCGRLKMVRRLLELMHNDDRPGEPTEHSELKNAFTVQEYTEIRRMALWYRHVGSLQSGLDCDCCGKSISRSRVLCMECDRDSKDGPASTVEFDAKESCVSCSRLLGRDDLRTPHLPSHLLFKTRDMLFLKDYFLLKTRAVNGATLGTRLYRQAQMSATTTTISTTLVLGRASSEPHVVDASSTVVLDTVAPISASIVNESESTDSDDEEPETEVITLKCLICHERVSTPCWYCLDCRQESEDAFVCRACETAIEELFPWDYLRRYRTEVRYHKETVYDKKAKVYKETLAAFSPSAHNVLHLLVRIGNTDKDVTPADEATNDSHEQQVVSPSGDLRLREVEERLLRRMEEDKEQLGERLARMEAMLQALLPAASAVV